MKKFLIALLLMAAIALPLAPDTVRASAENTTAAQAMAVMEVTTGRVLYSKNDGQKLPMASTTKILTAIVVIEQADLDEVIEVDPRAVGVEGSSIYLAAKEKISVRDLLYGLMLQSGNDAAVALAYHVGGSLEGFAELMNKTARLIGAENSHFVTPHGLHDSNHYTTAYDLALITAYGLKNGEFRKIVSTLDYKANRESGRYPQVIHNKNKLLVSYKGCTGVKTGYTKAAGRCLVASSGREGLHVISVVLNCGPMFENCANLMEQAHSEYKMTQVLPVNTHLGKLDVIGAKIPSVQVYVKEGFSYPLKDDERKRVYCRVELPQSVSAPVEKDSAIGKIKIYLDNQLLFSTEIYTIEEVKEYSFRDKLEFLIEKWLRR